MNLRTVLQIPGFQTASARNSIRTAVRSRRSDARRAIRTGAVALVLLTAGMTLTLDVLRPQWRDPEFYVRLDRLKRWQAERPERPLVVAFGSSRTQMGLDPAAMAYPDRPGSPIVFNMGYGGAVPIGVYLQLKRTLDAGVKPKAVVIQIHGWEIMPPEPAEQRLSHWVSRFSAGDVIRLGPFTDKPSVLPQSWLKSRLSPSSKYWLAILSDFQSDWRSQEELTLCFWDRADDYGYIANDLKLPPERRTHFQNGIRSRHSSGFPALRPAEIAGRVFREMVAQCRAEGIAIAFVWAPNPPCYLSWRAPTYAAEEAAYQRQLESELGVTVFPAPDHLLTDEDFSDGVHLTRVAAERYSRWLADTHLTPWLTKLEAR